MEFLQLNIRYGKVIKRMDNKFRGYIFVEDDGYFEGIVLDLKSSDNGSFIFGVIDDDSYDIYQIFNRQAADYINYNRSIHHNVPTRGKAYSYKEGKKELIGSCSVLKLSVKSNVDLRELNNQINSCKNGLSIYDKKTYESIIGKLFSDNGYVKQKTL